MDTQAMPNMKILYNQGDKPTEFNLGIGELEYNKTDNKLYTIGSHKEVIDVAGNKEYRTYTFNQTGWTTIAETIVGRTVGDFEMYDGNSGKHQYMNFIASALYGKDRLNVLHRNSYNLSASVITGIRVMYDLNDRTYGGSELQVWVAEINKPVNFSMRRDMRNQYESWKFLEEPHLTHVNWETGAILGHLPSMKAEWVYPTMQSGFSNYGGGYVPCRWRRDFDNKVTIEFMVKGTAATGTLFVLENGARPDNRLLLPSVMSGGHGRVDITAAGEVSIITGSTAWNGFSTTYFADT